MINFRYKEKKIHGSRNKLGYLYFLCHFGRSNLRLLSWTSCWSAVCKQRCQQSNVFFVPSCQRLRCQTILCQTFAPFVEVSTKTIIIFCHQTLFSGVTRFAQSNKWTKQCILVYTVVTGFQVYISPLQTLFFSPHKLFSSFISSCCPYEAKHTFVCAGWERERKKQGDQDRRTDRRANRQTDLLQVLDSLPLSH